MRVLLGVVLALALAAPASAQSPIAGAGSFNDAAVLAPGRYKDTLRGGEQLFYAVTLKPGQKLTAGATVSGRTEGSYFIKLAIYSPLRQKDGFKGAQTEGFGAADKSVSLRVEGQTVGERADRRISDSVYAEPGQKLTAGATVSGRTEGSYFIKLAIYSPLRQKDGFKGAQTEGFGAADKSVSLRVEGQTVGERANQGVSDSVYAEPGTFYVSLAADNFGRNLEADQFDSLLDLQVTGTPIPEATPTATAKPAATVQSGQTAGLGGGGDGGSGELGITIVLGLALGGLVGFGVRRLRAPA